MVWHVTESLSWEFWIPVFWLPKEIHEMISFPKLMITHVLGSWSLLKGYFIPSQRLHFPEKLNSSLEDLSLAFWFN